MRYVSFAEFVQPGLDRPGGFPEPAEIGVHLLGMRSAEPPCRFNKPPACFAFLLKVRGRRGRHRAQLVRQTNATTLAPLV